MILKLCNPTELLVALIFCSGFRDPFILLLYRWIFPWGAPVGGNAGWQYTTSSPGAVRCKKKGYGCDSRGTWTCAAEKIWILTSPYIFTVLRLQSTYSCWITPTLSFSFCTSETETFLDRNMPGSWWFPTLGVSTERYGRQRTEMCLWAEGKESWNPAFLWYLGDGRWW